MPLATESVGACPLCDSANAQTWRTDCRDWQQPDAADRFHYERCSRCHAHFLAVRPRESELGRVYFAGYAPYRPASVEGPGRSAGARPLDAAGAAVVRRLGRRLARQLERTYRPEQGHETLLDYGCGAPTFLDQARERGFATVGADFTEEVLRAVRANGHEAFLVGDELDRHLPDGTVSCVRMNHVIEHLYDPREALGAVHRKMRRGGRIHISTPNPASIGSALFRRRWHALDCPRHVILYRPDVLGRLLRELGFRDISVVHEVGPKDLVRSWGIVLYDRGRIAHEEIARLESDRRRAGLMLPIAALGGLIGRTDRFHVFGRRG